jgi:hypothetical protein
MDKIIQFQRATVAEHIQAENTKDYDPGFLQSPSIRFNVVFAYAILNTSLLLKKLLPRCYG